MDMDAWQTAVNHKFNLDSLTTIAQMEVLQALEPYRNRPLNELYTFLSRDILKLLKPFDSVGRDLSASYFEEMHQLAVANPATPVEPLGAVVATALTEDKQANRNRPSLAGIIREENNPSLNISAPDPVIDIFEPTPHIETPEVPKAVKLPKPPAPKLDDFKTKMISLKDDIKAEKVTSFEDIQTRVAEGVQAQLFDNDRENMDYYADLEKHVVAVKRIPSSGGCSWCKRSAMWADGNSKSHKFCKCTTGYIYSGEDEDKFIDAEQKKFMNDYHDAKEKLKNGEVQGRMIKQGSRSKEIVMGREIQASALDKVKEIEKLEAEKLGRPLWKKEQKAIKRKITDDSKDLAAKLNTGEPLSLEDKQKLHEYGVDVKSMRETKYATTATDADVMAVLRKEYGYR
jgi:hypothetical protein